MHPKITYLKLWNEIYKILEPCIYDLFFIEYLLESEEEKWENTKNVFEILDIPIKYLSFANLIIPWVLKSFTSEKKKAGGASFFKWDLGLLAHHNFMWVNEFMRTHCISNLDEIWNIREYYININNNKKEDNYKFIWKWEEKIDMGMEDFIKRMTGLSYNQYNKDVS